MQETVEKLISSQLIWYELQSILNQLGLGRCGWWKHR